MALTHEQEDIISTVKEDKCSLLLIDAKAGTGKSFTLKQIVQALKPKNRIYLAFNKTVAVEASRSFPKEIDCRTLHSYAYKHTVAPLRLSIGFFGYSNIKERMDFIFKLALVDLINKFLLSRHIKIDDFIKENQKEFQTLEANNQHLNIKKIFDKYIKQIISGKYGTTHNGYVKLFHMMLHNNEITIPSYDIALYDEGADANEVAIEIFKLIHAKKKIVAFDAAQAIYSFTHCISCADAFRDEGITKKLSKTYRCRPEIAQQIQNFMQEFYEPDFEFIGTEPENENIESIMYLSRTNSALVGKIIELISISSKFKLLRDPKSIFELILILLNLKENGKILNIEWSHLQDDVNEYYRNYDSMKKEYKTVLAYIYDIYSEDPQISSATNIIMEYGASKIYDAYNYAKQHCNDKDTGSIKVSTIFTAKGDEADKVEILDDINTMVNRVLGKPKNEWTAKELEDLRLAYVAVSRAKKQLVGATFLKYAKKNQEVEIKEDISI